MQKRTTTQQLQNAITNNLLTIAKAEIHHKSSKQVDILSVDSFKESLEFLAETIFSDMLDWHYEKNINADGEYIFDSGRMNSHSEIIIIAHLCARDGVSDDDIEQALLFLED